MRLSFHGGASEVGRSCVKVQTKHSGLLLDAGIKITKEGTEYPALRDVSDIKAVALSHAHLDHCGALPYFNAKGLSCNTYCTRMTKILSTILLKDSFHVEQLSRIHPAYHKEHLVTALNLMKTVQFRDSVTINDAKLVFFDAGHIPGSSSVMVEAEGKKILYTGDINTEETRLVQGADISYGAVDVLICDTTYGNRDHPDRKLEEKRFVDDVKETISHGGSVLISVFAVGRAQEIMLILADYDIGKPIYVDGMAKKVQARIMGQPEWIRDARMFRHAVRLAKQVKGYKERQDIIHTQSIIISPSGRLEGGPVVEYLKDYWQHPEDIVMLTGYQAEGTNGRLLVDTGEVYIDGTKVKARCKVKKYDFSSHIGMSQLHTYIKKVQPRLLVPNHGDPEALNALAKWAKNEGIDCRVPKIGDVIQI